MAVMPAPEVESVVPVSKSPEPTVRELMAPVPLPRRMPVSVVEAVPPFAIWRIPAVPSVSVPPENERPEENAVDATVPLAPVERSAEGVERMSALVEAVEK